MHPDTPHYYDSDTYASNFTYCNYTYLAANEELLAASTSKSQDNPKMIKEAQSCTDWSEWQQAMDSEINTLKSAGTWIDVPHSTNKNIV